MNLGDVIQELRELNEPVPNPLRLPTVQEVDRAERGLKVKFHPDYRKYLLEASDVVYGALEPATVVPDEEPTDLTIIAEEAWEMGVPRNLLPICADNGDYYCMNKAGEVVYWSHDGATDERWPNLATWIKEVWIEEG